MPCCRPSRNITLGNRAGCLLAHQLRVQAAGRRVVELQLPDGTRTCQEEQIVNQFERFCSDLYTAEELDEEGVEEYLNAIPLTPILPAASDLMDGDITTAEVLAAIHRLPLGKAPGAYGFGAEYYKSFSPLLATVLALFI
ncbi:hypothetical protein NDU88_000118 [Pleurodeles waltl]|uniref:Uncharacterized protein n=1 Tax=Pleurodeles waltl TaxID=8319 RepID=A0AAV7KLI5_PLEWA|nr:hypothetical protein NDU88_000118 [Pleurodeles waltl]